MDWARAIEINHAALTRIVAALIAMVGLVDGRAGLRLPHSLCLAVLRVLRPAESAVRRLIVIAARGLVVKPPTVRPMPKGLTLAGRGGGRITFPLFDAALAFAPTCCANPTTKVEPRIHSFTTTPLVPLFQPRPAPGPAPEPDREVDALRLVRRLAAVKMALETLPRQAKRLARWQARRGAMRNATPKSPLRRGPPPGHRNTPKDDVDRVLKECHALARDVLAENTS